MMLILYFISNVIGSIILHPNVDTRRLCAYFESVSDNNYNDTADIFLVHPMIEGSSTHQVLFTVVTDIDTTTFCICRFFS